MAATRNLISSSIKMIMNFGVNPETQKQVMKTKSFSNVRTDATTDNIYAAAKALSSLQTHSVTSVRRVDTFEIVFE